MWPGPSLCHQTPGFAVRTLGCGTLSLGELVVGKNGVYPYAVYNSSMYNLDMVMGIGLLELLNKEYVPALWLTKISAGYNYLKHYAAKGNGGEETLIKEAPIIADQYFDYGNVDEKGNLTVNLQGAIKVTRASVLENGGFPVIDEDARINTDTSLPSLKWGELAHLIRQKPSVMDNSREEYTAILGHPQWWELLRILNPLRKRISEEGKVVIDDGFYGWIAKEVRAHVTGVDEKKKREISHQYADMVVDFLQFHHWPVDVQTEIQGDNSDPGMLSPGGIAMDKIIVEQKGKRIKINQHSHNLPSDSFPAYLYQADGFIPLLMQMTLIEGDIF